MISTVPADDRAFAMTRRVIEQIADQTHRRYVALYPIGFEVIVGDDGRRQFRVLDEDGLAERLDSTLAAAAVSGRGRVNWLVYDQRTGECRTRAASAMRESLRRQQFPDW